MLRSKKKILFIKKYSYTKLVNLIFEEKRVAGKIINLKKKFL